MSVFANAIGKWSDLADAATSPGQAAASAATAAAAATPATPAAAAAATATTAAATTCFLHAVLGRSGVFLVEHIERREANVGNFFFAKREFVTQSNDRRLRRIRGRRDCCGCAAYE